MVEEQSEDEIGKLLRNVFGTKNIGEEPKVDSKKADYLVIPLDVFIEVHAIKDIDFSLNRESFAISQSQP